MESDGHSQQIDGEQTDRVMVKEGHKDRKKDARHSEAEGVQSGVSDLIINMYIIRFTPTHSLGESQQLDLPSISTLQI